MNTQYEREMDERTLVHRVCKFIREIQALERDIDEYPCEGCDLKFEHPHYRTCIKGCVLQAQELIRIARGADSAAQATPTDHSSARRLLSGESPSKIATELGVHRKTAIKRAIQWIEKQPWFSVDEYIEELKKPGSGELTSARTLFRRYAVSAEGCKPRA